MGHSLGGVFASEYAVNHQDKIKGAVYLAAYPSKNASNAAFKSLSIRGSLDELTTSQKIDESKNKFPANTTFITIPGGNHYNNGNYGSKLEIITVLLQGTSSRAKLWTI
jgi:predicted alpha/beta hydrolase family esterase